MSKALVCFYHRSLFIGEYSFLVLFLTCLPHQQLLDFSFFCLPNLVAICRQSSDYILSTCLDQFCWEVVDSSWLPILKWLYCSLNFSAKDGVVILCVCLGTVQCWWISTGLVQLKAVFCPPWACWSLLNQGLYGCKHCLPLVSRIARTVRLCCVGNQLFTDAFPFCFFCPLCYLFELFSFVVHYCFDCLVWVWVLVKLFPPANFSLQQFFVWAFSVSLSHNSGFPLLCLCVCVCACACVCVCVCAYVCVCSRLWNVQLWH